MKTNKKILLLFLVIGVLFIISSIFNLNVLTVASTVLLIPVLILYYRYKTKNWFVPMVIVLLLFYVRDLLMLEGFFSNPRPILWSFGGAVLILYVFAFTGFKWARIHLVEFISLMIMYTFLGFLFYTMADLVPQVIPSHQETAYIYMLLLICLLAVTFTQYLLKSHYASLWLMLASASLLLSELSLFYRLFIIPDISVIIFYPLFHVIAFFGLVEHASHRRKSSLLPGF
ncbi:hypothetical protein [Salinimicrobium sp. TH3]|uniref:hypothetical protein n=1 Tax=Salinimicrobium sp. TH3 TaxID=2997342 RepID=UPI002275A334|nr:hypothetical protein [Salinimicrobium sp. TH3]MCY2687737.1 hypothetical protein [Salinimicrobium sp. TH3]